MERLQKCPRSRITGMETYKINCGKNLLLGYESVKASDDTSNHKDDFVHVVLSELKDYDKPVIVKVYDEDNFHLPIEINILKTIKGYRNTAQLLCDFSCNDDKNKYISKIKSHIRFCGNGLHKLHFFVYEYIEKGDIHEFLSKNQNIHVIKALILQLTCVIIELATIYRISHGDIHTGNILMDSVTEKTVDYCIEGDIVSIESHGIMPKMIDYGRSNFYKGDISKEEVWFDIIMALGVIYHYIQDDELKQKVLGISKKTDKVLPSLKDYYFYIRDTL
jgi:serine/threonine protein kinase